MRAIKAAIVGAILLLGLGCGGYDPTLLVPDGGVDHVLEDAQKQILQTRFALYQLSPVIRDCGQFGPGYDCKTIADSYDAANEAVGQAYNELQRVIDAKNALDRLR